MGLQKNRLRDPQFYSSIGTHAAVKWGTVMHCNQLFSVDAEDSWLRYNSYNFVCFTSQNRNHTLFHHVQSIFHLQVQNLEFLIP